jgi:hypothetical protein
MELSMLHFLELDDFTLVVPGPNDIAWYQKNMGYAKELNHEFLKNLKVPLIGGRLTGSFIYAHPPDYIGRPTMTWGVSEWRILFSELKELGIDTVIYQAAVWLEVKESYYPSSLFPDFKTWDSIGSLCKAATEENLTLFLGGLGNLMCFDWNATAETYQHDRDAQLACFKEINSLFEGGFQGFYMSPETGYPGSRQPEREALLNQYFKDVCQGVKSENPDLPILMSPGTYYRPNHDQDFFDFLVSVFKDCSIDIMAPQDSIGAFGNRLPHLETSLQLWSTVCETLGFVFWVNVESFERIKIGTANDFRPADFSRLAAQLSIADQFADKIISWEVPYFYSKFSGTAGELLRSSYLTSLKKGERT